jgi:hypothetical protein
MVSPELFVKFNPELRKHLRLLKGAPALVFLCIALHCGKRGTAFPSEKRIAKLTGYSVYWVKRALRKLKEDRFIRVLESGRNTNGRYTSNVYALCRLVGFGSEEQISDALAANWQPVEVEIKQLEMQEVEARGVTYLPLDGG